MGSGWGSDTTMIGSSLCGEWLCGCVGVASLSGGVIPGRGSVFGSLLKQLMIV